MILFTTLIDLPYFKFILMKFLNSFIFLLRQEYNRDSIWDKFVFDKIRKKCRWMCQDGEFWRSVNQCTFIEIHWSRFCCPIIKLCIYSINRITPSQHERSSCGSIISANNVKLGYSVLSFDKWRTTHLVLKIKVYLQKNKPRLSNLKHIWNGLLLRKLWNFDL